MDFMGLLNEGLQAVIMVVVPIICGFVVSGLKRANAIAQEKVQSEKARGYIEDAMNAVCTAVAYTGQTYVDGLKGTNTFSAENQLAALYRAKDTALGLLTKDAVAFLEKAYGDVGQYIEKLIEEQVYLQKKQ